MPSRHRPFGAQGRLHRRQDAGRAAGQEEAEHTFLGPEQIRAALQELADRHTGPIAVLGGVAGQLYGTRRLTADLDVLALNPLPGFVNQGRLALNDASMYGYSSKTAAGIPLDVLLPGRALRVLAVEAIRGARVHAESPVPVLRAEHWAAFKLMAARGKDEDDLKAAIAAGFLDPAVARPVIEKHLGLYARQEFDAIVSLALWEQRREQ